MAEAGASGEKPQASAAGRMIGLAALTLLAAGSGGGSAYYLVKKAIMARPPEAAAPEKASAPTKDAPPAPPGGGDVVNIPVPVVLTNLADPPGVFVRLESEIVLDAKTAKASGALAAEISGDFMAFLRSLSLANLEGPSAFTQLKEDLTDRAQIRSKGAVREIIIKGLVVK